MFNVQPVTCPLPKIKKSCGVLSIIRRFKKVFNQEGAQYLMPFGPENPLETIDSNVPGGCRGSPPLLFVSALRLRIAGFYS